MTLYETLNISTFIGKTVRVSMNDGILYNGTLDLDCLNEDWEEDGEPKMIGLKIGEYLEGVPLSEVKSVEKREQIAE